MQQTVTTGTTVEQLPCKLTQEERDLKVEEMLRLRQKIATLEAEKKATADDFKTQINDVLSRVEQLETEVRERYEVRPVECYEQPRYELNRVDLVRSDTREAIRSRPLHPGERQTKLELVTSPRPEPKKVSVPAADYTGSDSPDEEDEAAEEHETH